MVLPMGVNQIGLNHNSERGLYLSFGADLAHVIDLTESLIIGNENIDQNVELE